MNAARWTKMKDEWKSSAGWSILSRLALDDKTMKDEELTYIERFIKAVEIEVDAQLEEMGEPPLMNFIVEQACMRGRVAVRAAVIKDGATGKPEIRIDALDSRYFVYKMVRGGMLWGASFYNRDKEEIEYEYNTKLEGKGYQQEQEVIDYWDRTGNKVWIVQLCS